MRPVMARVTLYALGMVTLVASVATSAQAGFAVVPEIDGSAVPAVLGILSSGVLILRAARRGSK
jgi:hypothetical protein